jgi:serine/threonine protein kinase
MTTFENVHGLLTLLGQNKIDFNTCDVNDSVYEFSEFKKISKNSASNTEVAFGMLALKSIGEGNLTIPVSAKVFINEQKGDENYLHIQGLRYEATLYKQITEEIIKPNLSPNFSSYLGFACCRELKNINNGTYDNQPNIRSLQMILKGTQGEMGMCVLITERVGNGSYFGYNELLPVYTLHDVFNDLNTHDKHCVMFQVLYGLELMQRFGIMHNDLHSRNILVMELPEPVSMGFSISTKDFKIVTKYIPYIFDWDRGYSERIGNNDLVFEYEDVGSYNRMSERADLYTLLCTLSFPEFLYPVNGAIAFKEKEEHIPITKKEVDIIRSHEPYAIYNSNKRNPVYKMSSKQLQEILGDVRGIFVKGEDEKYEEATTDILKNVQTLKFVIVAQIEDRNGVEVKQYYLNAYSGFQCRMSLVPKDFPTPYMLLMSKFDDFLVNTLDTPGKYTYTMPAIVRERPIYTEHAGVYRDYTQRKKVEGGMSKQRKQGSTFIRSKKENDIFSTNSEGENKEIPKMYKKIILKPSKTKKNKMLKPTINLVSSSSSKTKTRKNEMLRPTISLLDPSPPYL